MNSIAGISLAGLLRLLSLLLLLSGGLRAEYVPALSKVMSKEDVLGSKPFAGSVDVNANGKWIASSSQGTWRFLNDGNPASLVLSSANPGNGSLSTKRIVKINSNGDWIIMTSSGVYKNGTVVLSNTGSTNIGGNILYWSIDFNSQGDWAAISSRGTFVNGTRITVDPNPDSSTTVDANDLGEMLVKISDQDLSNTFTWMAISPKGIF